MAFSVDTSYLTFALRSALSIYYDPPTPISYDKECPPRRFETVIVTSSTMSVVDQGWVEASEDTIYARYLHPVS